MPPAVAIKTKCSGCGVELESRSALFRHLKETDGACLDPQEMKEYREDMATRGLYKRKKIILLFGYVTSGPSVKATDSSNVSDMEGKYDPHLIRNGDDAGRLLLHTIEEEFLEDARSVITEETKLNRSYGSLSRPEAAAQDEYTSAASEILATWLPELRESTQSWIERINRRLEDRLAPLRASENDPHSRRPIVRLLGRLALPQKKFNAELDFSHRKVDYLLPADFLYGDGSSFFECPGYEALLNSTNPTLHDFRKSRAAFFYALPSFPDGFHRKHEINYPAKEVQPFSTSTPVEQVEGYDFSHSARRPARLTLAFLYGLKSIMKRFTTQAEALDASDQSAVQQKLRVQATRKNQKRAREEEKQAQRNALNNKPETLRGANSAESTSDGHKKSPEKKKKQKKKSNLKDGKDNPNLGPNILKRRRFHNFTPTMMAHEYLAHRRMDRLYHRSTLRFLSSTDGRTIPFWEDMSADEEKNRLVHGDGSVRPFITISATGDLFLQEQLRRIIGVFIAIARGLLPVGFVDCLFEEEYTDLIPTIPVPETGLYASETAYMTWEGKTQMVLCPRQCTGFKEGWKDDDTLRYVDEFQTLVRTQLAHAWLQQGVEPDTGRLVAEREWTDNVLLPWVEKAKEQYNEFLRWQQSRLSANESVPIPLSPEAPLSLDNLDTTVPPLYEKVLYYLRLADSSGLWPNTTLKRQLVMVANLTEEASKDPVNSNRSLTLSESQFRAKWGLMEASTTRSSSQAYAFEQGEGGASGSFSVGAMPGKSHQPKANETFPELMKAAFELETALCPDRPPSSTIAINRNAQFRPHTDSGAGSGQSTSLIVGLGSYVGGELVVEGERKNIRYQAVEFDGWKQRHWTMPFKGERFSLVWFTPKGCEGMRGIDLCQ